MSDLSPVMKALVQAAREEQIEKAVGGIPDPSTYRQYKRNKARYRRFWRASIKGGNNSPVARLNREIAFTRVTTTSPRYEDMLRANRRRAKAGLDLTPRARDIVSFSSSAAIGKMFARRPPAPVQRNSLGQAKPKGVKAFRIGRNIRVIVGRDASGKTRINWGTVKKMIAARTA